jgi:hypothetical protein
MLNHALNEDASKPGHLDDAIAALAITLTPEERAALRHLSFSTLCCAARD